MTEDDRKTIRQTAEWLTSADLHVDAGDGETRREAYIESRLEDSEMQGDLRQSIRCLVDAWAALTSLHLMTGDVESAQMYATEAGSSAQEVMQDLVDEATDAIDRAPFACARTSELYDAVMDHLEREVEDAATRVGLESERVDGDGAPQQAASGDLFGTSPRRHKDEG